MKVRRAARLTLLSVVPVALGLPLQGQEAFRGWIGLHDDAQLAWLENENRLGDLCPEAATYDQCQREMSGPLLRVHDLYPEADPSSPRVGELLVVATPGRGLTAHFRPTGSDPIRSFVPDLFLQDWGYGPYFHQTLMDDEGDWLQLPTGPWSGPVWLRRQGEGVLTDVLEVYPESILEMNGSGWYVVATEPDALHLRPEQPGDMWCIEGEPPSIVPVEPRRFTREELLDPTGHLLVRPKYMKGC